MISKIKGRRRPKERGKKKKKKKKTLFSNLAVRNKELAPISLSLTIKPTYYHRF